MLGYSMLSLFVVVEGLIFSLRLLKPLPTSLFFVVLLAILFAIIYAVDTYRLAEKKYFKFDDGIFGENRVLKLLRALPDEYSIYRNCQTQQNNDTDFIVVGPTGIFVIEVKSSTGKIDFDGQRLTINGRPFIGKDPISQVWGEALSLRQYLLEKTDKEVFVNPAVVFSSKKVGLRFGLNKQRGVYIIQKQWLLDLITKQPIRPTVGHNEINTALEGLLLRFTAPVVN